ncbi:BAHD acyltransferase DCR [Cucurbita argyrosperma subsp. argyrosperma]|uniref:BAHD acyltransferase DCR-like n=1 Tax=Cucurbita moschata TaxID=3662 RepID=A0A6J1F0Z6_CUCMO|nr:BAHD acyltransferase DCR-like [Cucurbita moschata]KAG7017240.1 BAHD acyltransferase DCR [Cucurbita argyrosperma subsp. argyrosperma]
MPSSSSSSSSSISIVSKCSVFPYQPSSLNSVKLKLSVSDLPMLSCHYIQKGVLLSSPPYSLADFVSFLKLSLSATLSHFPPLAGRFSTDADGYVYILCNDAGVEFIEAKAKHLTLHALLSPLDLPVYFKDFFYFDRTISYSGHSNPLLAVQVTELADGVFVGCTVNHAVTDGTSFWHFFNTFAEICKGTKKISNSPDFSRNTVFNSPVPLKFPEGGPVVTFNGDEPLRERIFHFTRESILKLKLRANVNNQVTGRKPVNGFYDAGKILGKQGNDSWKTVDGNNGTNNEGNITSVLENLIKTNVPSRTAEISSFQSLCAHLWRSVTRARKLDESKTTTFRMAVNCRHRLNPRMDPYYFGNAIQSIPTVAPVGELLSNDLRWCADLLHKNVVTHDDATVRRGIADWESQPRLFPLGNSDGASITMGSSPRFPMYDNDFGWGRPIAVRSGKANKFDGKISAFPGREGNGSVDLEIVLSPETMAGLERDPDFMQYVSTPV